MSADAFLDAHQWGELAVFDLASRLTTISIRDQMMRARMLADRLPGWLQKRDGSRFKEGRILVVGGGACGLAAGVALAQQGFPVDVVEVKAEPFHVQAHCTSRWVDPTQYDWPNDQWRRSAFPWPNNPGRFPFPWTAHFANQIVANQWVPQLVNWETTLNQAHPGILRRYHGLRPGTPRPRPSGKLEVELFDVADNRSLGLEEFTAVVLAFGFGPERCNLPGSPHFKGFSFWRTDTFQDPASGVAGEDTVLISGSGDGSLQDLVRVVTRQRSVRAVFDLLNLGGLGIDWTTIFSAEQRAERALTWSLGEAFAAPHVRALHLAYRTTVQVLLQQHAALPGQIATLFAARPARTILVNPKEYFTCNYGLNRFIALLLIEAIQDDTLVVRPNRKVQQIFSAAPPAPSPETCRGHDWKVVLGDARTQAFAETVDANVIILRHGVDPPEVSVPEKELRREVPRPVPPMHLY